MNVNLEITFSYIHFMKNSIHSLTGSTCNHDLSPMELLFSVLLYNFLEDSFIYIKVIWDKTLFKLCKILWLKILYQLKNANLKV
jgi:hypothetical protein